MCFCFIWLLFYLIFLTFDFSFIIFLFLKMILFCFILNLLLPGIFFSFLLQGIIVNLIKFSLFGTRRERFDALVGKIGDLEKEKLTLIDTMKGASASSGSSKDGGKGGGKNALSAEALQERLKVGG